MRSDEREASPERLTSTTGAAEEVEKPFSPAEKEERRDQLSRQVTTSTSSRASRASSESVQRQEIGVSRATTQRDDVDLERHPTALSRIQTGRSQHSQTLASGLRSRTTTRQSRKPMPNFGAGKPFPPHLPEREEYVVEFDGPGDPMHAQNWPLKKKLIVSVVLGYVTLCAAFGSSIFSVTTQTVAIQFGVSSEVGILGVSLYVLGFATGPILWAPASELYGRKLPLITASFGFSIFNLAVAVAKDAQTIFICRFFGGFFGACPLTCESTRWVEVYPESMTIC